MKKNAGQIMIHDEQENMEWKKTRNIWINMMNMNNKNMIANYGHEENKSNTNHEILINFLTWKKPTGNVVAEDARSDDSSKGSEKWFQFLLTHSFWEPWYVQICSFYGLRRWASERYLRNKIR